MAQDARIGYMPARVWGCPTTAMWVYRLGAERAKRMLLTGDTIDGRTAADRGLVLDAAPPRDRGGGGQPARHGEADDRSGVRHMGLHGTRILATLFDGITRHSSEERGFQQFAATHGFHEAVRWRDSGRWITDGGGPVPTAQDLKE
jgi:enoyl-CoA hydratase